MKPFLTTILPLFFTLTAHADLTEDCTKFWSDIRHANDQFEEHQDLTAGKKLLALLPSDKVHAPAECPKRAETIDALYRDHSFRSKLVQSGKELGFQITIRLMRSADGAFAEDLDADLANSIPKHAEKFLTLWKEEKSDAYCPKELVLSAGGEDLTEKQRASLYQKRMVALQKVKNTKRADLKTDCIKILKAKN